jgi:hypothetical protein
MAKKWNHHPTQVISEKYVEGITGTVYVIQTPNKIWDPTTVWHKNEKPMLIDQKKMGIVDDIDMYLINEKSQLIKIPENYKKELLKFDQRKLR